MRGDVAKRTMPKKLNSRQQENRPRLKKKSYQCDFTILFVTILLVLFGIVMITSSSFYYSLNKFGDSFHFFKRQMIWAAAGFLVMIVCMNYDYRKLKKWSLLLYGISIITLILVLFIGQEINGAKRWLGVGSLGFQPSEFSKIAVILFLAHIVSNQPKRLAAFKGFLTFMFFILLPCGLIAKENLSTALVVAFLGIIILFVASTKIWHFLVITLPVFLLGGIAVLLPEFRYRLNRIIIWLNPWEDPSGLGYQTIQSLYAVGSGGLFGVGLGQSIQKRGFIPEAHNDIIFSIVCEELGLFGAAILLFLFLILIWRGIKIAMNAPDLFGGLLVVGVISQVAVQLIINVSVITNTIPVTGMPLPFISYGGSSLLFLMAGIGIVLNVSRHSKIEKI